MFWIIFFTIILSIGQCLGDTCSCTCCSGNGCEATLLGSTTVSSCSSTSCKSLCQSQYPSQCTDGSGSTSYVCKGGGGVVGGGDGTSSATANWIGTFNFRNSCDKRSCCCPTGQLINTKLSETQLHVRTPLTGEGCRTESVLEGRIDIPREHSFQLPFLGNSILVTLSEDSRTIELKNLLFPQCSEIATRNHGYLTANFNTTLLFLSISLFAFKQFIRFE